MQLVLGITVGAQAPGAGEAAEAEAAARYARGGAHDGKRTLLLREFVQGVHPIPHASKADLPLS